MNGLNTKKSPGDRKIFAITINVIISECSKLEVKATQVDRSIAVDSPF